LSSHATLMSWSPGVNRNLMRDRSSIWSPMTVLFARLAAQSSGPPTLVASV
jgi:hypothetical protein